MDAQDYPIRHFEEMAALAAALKALPAQIQHHTYYYETAGSWATVLRYKGVRVRIVFDGRDSAYTVQKSRTRKPPDQWADPSWRSAADPGSGIPLPEITRAVVVCVSGS